MINLMLLEASGILDILMTQWPLIFIVLIIYFLMLRPQANKQKNQDLFLENLDKGKEVVTASGIIGRVKGIEGPIVTLELGQKTFIRITKNSISKEMTEAFLNTNEKVES